MSPIDEAVHRRPGSPSGSGEMGTVVICFALAWTVIQWLLTAAVTLAYGESTASGTPVWILLAYTLLAMLSLLVAIASFVVTGFWLSRARRNADLIAPDQQRWSRVWVWLSWIVPVVSYWCPKQVIDDVWRSTVGDPGKPNTRWWWGAFIAMAMIGIAGNLTSGDPTHGDEVVYEWIGAMATTVAAVFWIRVVRTLSHAQDALAGGAVPGMP